VAGDIGEVVGGAWVCIVGNERQARYDEGLRRML
jgi:hypothetical protein